MTHSHAVIIGTGSYLPEKIVDNKALEATVDTSDTWIRERTGITQRHIAAEEEHTSDLAYKAAKKALENANIDANDIDLIILATTTPDNTFPATAAKVQAMLGNTTGAAFDVQAVCAGFIYALSVADQFIRAGNAKHVLVIGAEILTRIVDWEDRNTCVLFGDGAGAIVLQAEKNTERGILSTHLHSDGSTRELLYTDGGVASTGNAGKMRMEGKEVFKHAVEKMTACTLESLEANHLSASDIEWMVPHQANWRIMSATAKRLGITEDRVIQTVQLHANTSAASIPLALDVARKDGRLQTGQLVSLQAIGGGLSWGSCLLKW